MLCCFWAFINICINEGKLGEVVAQLAKCRKDLPAHPTPENEGTRIPSITKINQENTI